MPQNPERDNSSLLVLDLGKLVMVSCKKEEEHKMYDKYTMNLVDFSLSIQGSNSSSSPSGIIASQQQEKIVEKFSLSVDIFSSIVPNELTIPTLVVSSEISSAKVNVSIQSLLALNRYRELFLPERDSASPAAHSGDDETYDEQAAIEYKQLTIEQITKAQNDLDEVERLSKEHVNKREAFLKALAEHKVVDAVFKVGDADLALLDETGVPIADFRVKDTALLYTGRTFSTTVDLTVGAISIGNTLFYREKRDLPYLGTSSKSGDSKKVCAFATVHFESFEKGTPVYKKVDNDLRVEFNYFYLIVVPEVFTKILKFANYM